MNINTLAFFSLPGHAEWIVILVVALLIFGKRLPEVARSIGKSIVEFKKGVREVTNDVERQSRTDPAGVSRLDHWEEPSPPRSATAPTQPPAPAPPPTSPQAHTESPTQSSSAPQ